jgi:hypothetical protein
MTFVTSYVTDKSTTYKGDTITNILSLAVSLVDDFTKKEGIGHLKVIIKEGKIDPIKNLSGYYIFTSLAEAIYTVSIASELYFPEERVIDISKIKTSNSMLKFYNKGPASGATSTKLKDVSKLQQDDIVEFSNAIGDIEQKKIIDVDTKTKKISWAGGLKYNFNIANNTIISLKNPVFTIPLKPLPSYPFRDHATLIRGLLLDSGENPVGDAIIKVTSLNLETRSDKRGEFVLYFKDIKNENILIEIEKNGKNKSFNITLEEGIMKSVGKIYFHND